ncbi:MAG: short-chain dehydrogenase [Acidimicrobiaceae bacterium]|jgi:NAD(P)-dependent dehydrogenase (short-subunit alcohol dehydrogenase family)|nr:short-chain dehydrogenase [Acidimicrobiaceae bacterium]MCH2632326.1 SDR family oxidoreductase [Acidimicrobiales bacterium]MEC9088410.1 SDR family oxidoreductase [Actinomycetota bacterium]MAP97686.1 short-chain dehydrogenase [Acidimicrobiaceae bacterium]HAA67102.1 short-chain dehydrogenase [Acidimicrobiaceae bacterium]|tara:strand:- start:280 stop:1146 length:867 start_codon:yes stop_codon:yes gene_type:complete
MTGQLESKVAIVTGGASGMGLATVRRFLEEGASVVVGDLNSDNGRQLLEELSADGYDEKVRFTVTDVSVEDDVAAMTELALDAFGRLDIVFNNAGIGGAFGPITELEVDDWDTTFHVLVRSVFLGTKHAAKVLIEQGQGGSIINTASIAGMGGGAGPQAYSAAKAAVVSLSKTTAVELAPHDIRVNAICPGVIFTPLMHSGNEEQAEEVIEEIQPLSKRGEGSDIAGMAVFLAGDDSLFVTGQEHIVDGGLLASGPRMIGRLHNSRNLHRMAGMAYGSSGQVPTFRRL